ncbi:MAG: DUF488 domain-containing protein [Oscillospiraceae bacterium]
MPETSPFVTKRIYLPAEATDGARVLVDRLWPRGISKERAALAAWLKDAAPSTALRQWFGHEPERFEDFSEKYRLELAADPEKQPAIRELLNMAQAGRVTLLYAAKSPTVNHAVVLKGYLDGLLAR